MDKSSTPANWGKRILSAALIVAVLAGFLFIRQLADSTVFLFDIFIGFLMIMGTFEVEGILRKSGRPTLIFGLGLFPVINFCVLIACILGGYGVLTFLLINLLILAVGFVLMLIFGGLTKRATTSAMVMDDFEGTRWQYSAIKSANTILGCIYPTFLLSFMFLLNHFAAFTDLDADLGLLGIVLALTTTIFADTAAMITGRLIKSKKINLKKLGPGKSWSGLVGGIVGATVASILVWLVFSSITGFGTVFAEKNVTFWMFIVGGLFFGIFNMMGDIFSSYIKRRAGVKDFSSLLPGHGGIMDRINGLVFNAMAVFAFMSFIFLA